MPATRSPRDSRRIIMGYNDPETLARLRVLLAAQLDAVHVVLEEKRRDCEAVRRSRSAPPPTEP